MPDVVVELRRVCLPLVRPFRTSRSVADSRTLLLVRWQTAGGDGWAECAADPEPIYFAETVDTAHSIIVRTLLPAIVANGAHCSAAAAHRVLSDVPGNQLAKAAIETAILDAELRAHRMRLVDYLGGTRTRIPVGVSVGIAEDVGELLDWVAGYLADGYRRVKLKIAPGWDVHPVAAVRREFGNDLALQVDANQAYHPSDQPALRRLDEFGLLVLEQPFHRDDLVAHARLAERLDTPLCLDESVTGLHSAATAIALGACRVINIKPARVGGYLAARALHDLCRAEGIPVFCGGVLECGVGRAANLALAALPNFTLPGDISATRRYFERDITQSFEVREGAIDVPPGDGSGTELDHDALDALTVRLDRIELEAARTTDDGTGRGD